MRRLNSRQEKIDAQAVELGKIHGSAERSLVEILIEVETERIHKLLGFKSMFLYATTRMELSDAVALMLINVARKAKDLPYFRNAISGKRLTPPKAARVVAHINSENEKEVVDFAFSHTQRQIDFEMARRDPKAAAKDRAKPISEDYVQVTVTITMKAYEDLQRAQSVLAQKGKDAGMGRAIGESLDHYLNAQDPVRKAKRSEAKRANVKKVCLHRVKSDGQSGSRVPLTAAEKHAVFARDQGKCTHIDQDGERCNSDRWIHTHHIIHVANGGTNDLENLTTLCSFHHDLVHQLSFGIEGDVNWLR